MATAVFSVFVYCYLYIIHSECHFSTSHSNCKTAKIEQDLKSLRVYTTKDFFGILLIIYTGCITIKMMIMFFFQMWLPVE